MRLEDNSIQNPGEESPNFIGWSLYHFLSSSYVSSVEGFFPLYISSIGASTSQVGFLVGIASLINISQIFWARIAARIQRNKIFVVLGRLLHALFYLPYILLFSIVQSRLVILFLFRSVQSIFQASTIPNHSALLAGHITQNDRPKRLNKFYRIGIVGSISGTLFGGLLFSLVTDYVDLPAEIAYFVLFCWAALIGSVASGIFYFSVPQFSNQLSETFQIRNNRSISNNLLKLVQIFPNFRQILLFSMIFYFAVSFAAPYYIILEVEYYGFSYFIASLLTTLTILTQILTSIIIGQFQLIEKLGKRLLIFIGLCLIAIASSMIIIPYYYPISAFWCFFIAWIIIGIGEGLFNITMSIFILDIVHPKYRVELIAIYNTLIGLIVFIGPLLGGILIELIQNITISFLVRSMIILVAVMFLTRVQDPLITGSLFEPVRLYFSRHLKAESPLSSDFDILQIKTKGK